MVIHHEQARRAVGRNWPRHRFGAIWGRLAIMHHGLGNCAEANTEGSPAVRAGTGGTNHSAVGQDHGLRNGEAQPQAAKFPCDGALALLTGGATSRALTPLNPAAGIANGDFALSRLRVWGGTRYSSAPLSKLAGVV